MKAMKKLASLLLALVMALALAVPAFAAGETYSITIANAAENHVYEAYQIFAGDLSTNTDGKKVLSNIVWGSGVSDAGKTALGDAAAKAETIKTEADAKTFAQAVAPYLTNAATSGTQTNGKYVISGLAAGYYLVKDEDNSLANKDDFYTAYIMRVVDNVGAAPKGDKPTLNKKIKHNDGETWGVVGDNQIGDTVEFRTISTVPDTSNYTSYTYIIHDTMSDGLTSNVKSAADVTIKVNDKDGNGTTLDSKYCTVEVDTKDANTFTVTIDILQAVKDGVLKAKDELYTYYSVTTDLIGLVKIQDGYRIATANDTAENITYVIEAGAVTIKGLDDATDYYLYETKAPVGYNQLKDPVKFKISATYSEDGSKLAEGSLTVSINDGAASTDLSANIENKAGSTLPSTGGIGTTIFYVVGSVLVIGAAVVLITRKRMGKSDK